MLQPESIPLKQLLGAVAVVDNILGDLFSRTEGSAHKKQVQTEGLNYRELAALHKKPSNS